MNSQPCIHCGQWQLHHGASDRCYNSVSRQYQSSPGDPPRDYLYEALAIVAGESAMQPERAHLVALHSALVAAHYEYGSIADWPVPDLDKWLADLGREDIGRENV